MRLYALSSLRNLGYQLVECSNGHDALEHLRKDEVFDLLFTDVVNARGISGNQVAQEAQKFMQELRVLFMSGYTNNAIVHHG